MTCPYCGHRDVKPGDDACATCEAPAPDPEAPYHSPTGSSLWSARRHRAASWFYWRGEWRQWDRSAA